MTITELYGLFSLWNITAGILFAICTIVAFFWYKFTWYEWGNYALQCGVLFIIANTIILLLYIGLNA